MNEVPNKCLFGDIYTNNGDGFSSLYWRVKYEGSEEGQKDWKNKGDNWVEKRGRGKVDEKEDMRMKEGKWSEMKELRSLKGSNLWHWESCHSQYDYCETDIWGLESQECELRCACGWISHEGCVSLCARYCPQLGEMYVRVVWVVPHVHLELLEITHCHISFIIWKWLTAKK